MSSISMEDVCICSRISDMFYLIHIDVECFMLPTRCRMSSVSETVQLSVSYLWAKSLHSLQIRRMSQDSLRRSRKMFPTVTGGLDSD